MPKEIEVFVLDSKEFKEILESSKSCEKLELLKEIQEYYERKENQLSMPLWLSVRIEKVINHNKNQ